MFEEQTGNWIQKNCKFEVLRDIAVCENVLGSAHDIELLENVIEFGVEVEIHLSVFPLMEQFGRKNCG